MLRLNKKGITHVDWAISMGIFIIYVSFLIIFIMPSLLRTQFDPSTLFDSFEKNFLEPIEWTVVKIPLNIEKLKKFKPSEGGLDRDVVLNFEFEEKTKYMFTKITPNDDGPGSGLMTVQEVTGASGQLLATEVQFDFVSSDKDKIRLHCEVEISPCQNILLKFSVASLKSKNKPEFDLKCEPDEDKNFCKASLGIEEEIKGIKEKPFLVGVDESTSFFEYKDVAGSGNDFRYSTLKKGDLKFSDNVNFDIWYQEVDSNGNLGNKKSLFDQFGDDESRKPPTVPENANVFIKEFKRFYVNEFGDLKPVVFYFETW